MRIRTTVSSGTGPQPWDLGDILSLSCASTLFLRASALRVGSDGSSPRGHAGVAAVETTRATGFEPCFLACTGNARFCSRVSTYLVLLPLCAQRSGPLFANPLYVLCRQTCGNQVRNAASQLAGTFITILKLLMNLSGEYLTWLRWACTVKQRMKSIQNMQKITKAMKMVAASKMRVAQVETMKSRGAVEPFLKLLGDHPGATRFFSSFR